jgi:CRP/FNR family cyclic AMP-dependent transcriptional regulator
MLKYLQDKFTPSPPHWNLSASERADFVDFPSATTAAELLIAPSALMQLRLPEAEVIVRYMRPSRIAEGTVFIQEGEEHDTDFMALILEGDVVVENIVVSRNEQLTLTVLGPGSLHGELGLLDGLPRSASCTAGSDLCCALLTRQTMLSLLDDDPKVGAKLMMAIAMRIGERLRDNTKKLKTYAALTKAMQEEIDNKFVDEEWRSGTVK